MPSILHLTHLKAKDGTSAITIDNSTGNVAVAGNLTGGNIEGTALKSTGESGGYKFLREDGDGTSSWDIAVPAGLISPMGMSSAPAGWLLCNGSAVSRTTYATLFAAIGTTWGTGDGSSTFNIPDLRGAYLRGIGTAGVSSDYVGPTNVGDYQNDQNASHNHTVTISSGGSHTHSYSVGIYHGAQTTRLAYGDTSATTRSSSSNGSHSHNGSTANSGSTEARVYNRGVQYCIKY